MVRPRNNVRLHKADKGGTKYDIWINTVGVRQRYGRRSTTTILKALKHYERCFMKDDV